MTEKPSNIVLIGMPGSGKSTVGIILAKKTSLAFVDTDVLIQASQQQSLQGIVDTQGYAALREIEEALLLGLSLHSHVIATGGSAVYSDKAMRHLKADGRIVFLDADINTLVNRIGDFSARGIAKRPGQSFAELFEERLALYKRHADITINGAKMNHEAVCDTIINAMDHTGPIGHSPGPQPPPPQC